MNPELYESVSDFTCPSRIAHFWSMEEELEEASLFLHVGDFCGVRSIGFQNACKMTQLTSKSAKYRFNMAEHSPKMRQYVHDSVDSMRKYFVYFFMCQCFLHSGLPLVDA